MKVALQSTVVCDAASFRFARRELLAFLRVYLGIILFVTVLGKLTRADPFVTEMLGFLNFAIRRAHPPYVDFLQRAVIPHATLFSYLVMTGELVAAISLLTGAATRIGAAVAMFLFLNFMLAKGRMFWSPDSQDAAVFFIALVVCLGQAGRAWGVDAYLARRWPRAVIW
jgi:thiosulfate dehydrogenase [quinone] large subunit